MTPDIYLTAIIDRYSRFIIGWALSDTLDTDPVLDAVKAAIEKYGIPAIINSDQGSWFTSHDYIEYLDSQRIAGAWTAKLIGWTRNPRKH